METGWLGPLVAIALAAIGGIGGYFTLRSSSGENTRRITALEVRLGESDARAKSHEDALGAYKLQVANEYVRSGAIEKLEERLGKMVESAVRPIFERMKELDHQMRGIDQKLDSRIISMLRVKGKDSE